MFQGRTNYLGMLVVVAALLFLWLLIVVVVFYHLATLEIFYSKKKLL